MVTPQPSISSGAADEDKKSLSSEELANVPDLDKKQQSSIGDESAVTHQEEFVPPVEVPWKLKWIALFFTALLPLGSNWAGSTMSPLKATFRTQLGINNTQYGVIDAAGSIVGSIWPIVGGMCLDWYGYAWISISCTTVILLGTMVSALASSTDNWRMLVGGAILQSFGVAVLDGSQHKLFYHWFGYRGLALAFGLETTFSRLTQMIAGMVALPIRNATGTYAWSLWVPVIMSGAALVANITLALWERLFVEKRFRLSAARETSIASQKSRWNFNSLKLLPWVFWDAIVSVPRTTAQRLTFIVRRMIPMTQLFQAEATGAFTAGFTDLVTKRGYKEEVAAFTANARSILPIVLAPFVGIAIDRWGHRFHYTAVAPLFFVVAFVTLGYTAVHPLVPIVVFSLGSVINYMPFQVVIPLLVRDQNKLGTAFGVYRAFAQSGTTILEVLFGIVQDSTSLDNPYSADYKYVITMGLVLKIIAFFLGIFYIYIDKRYLASATTMSEKRRTELEAEIEDPHSHPLTARPVNRTITVAGVVLFFAMLAGSWALFFRYVV